MPLLIMRHVGDAVFLAALLLARHRGLVFHDKSVGTLRF